MIFMVLVFCAACAGRDPQPVAITQPQDATMDCAMIQAEISANNRRIQELANEQGWKVAQNVAAGVVGLVIWPVWFGMDAKGAAATEAKALESRQHYLATLAAYRCAEASTRK
jgi:hypothetical protein